MQEAKQYEKEPFGEHPPGGEGREDALGYFYFKLHTLTVVLATFSTRNRRNKFCLTCQHCELYHRISFNIRSRNSFIRIFCSCTGMRIRGKHKTIILYQSSFLLHMYIQSCGYLFSFLLKYSENIPPTPFPFVKQLFYNIPSSCTIYQMLKRITLSGFRLTTDTVYDYLVRYTSYRTLWV